jgi:hypothetical protein
VSVKGIRETRTLWTVMRVEQDEDGRDDGCVRVGSFWEEPLAVAEQQLLEAANSDPTVRHEVIASEPTVVYPADESPPWVPDPDRLKRRGYEEHEH